MGFFPHTQHIALLRSVVEVPVMGRAKRTPDGGDLGGHGAGLDLGGHGSGLELGGHGAGDVMGT